MLKTISCILVLSSPALAGALDTPVVGGHAAQPGEWPEVALVVAPNALCSGTLVAPDVVLTAGHCIEAHPFEVLVGTTDYSKPGGEKIQVASAIAYPDWQHQYDVGVLVLAHPSTARPRAIAATCTADAHLKDGALVRVVGFGLTTASGTGANTLLEEATLPVTDATCTRDAACNPAIAPGGELAAGGRGTDSCFGDSGGPLYVDVLRNAAVLGVVSRGEANAGQPCAGGGVYVRADKVVHWIEQTTHRTLARTTCSGKGDGEEPVESGCSAGGELAGGLLLLVVAAWLLALWRRRG
jgi:secreted trypsin-like serine protease